MVGATREVTWLGDIDPHWNTVKLDIQVLDHAAGGVIDPSEYFGPVDAKLFGTIPLGSLIPIDPATLVANASNNAPEIRGRRNEIRDRRNNHQTPGSATRSRRKLSITLLAGVGAELLRSPD